MMGCASPKRAVAHLTAKLNWGGSWSHELAPHRPRHRPRQWHEVTILLQGQRLRAVLQRLLGMWMNLDDEAVRASRQRRQRYRADQRAFAGALAGVYDDREMRELLDQRRRVDIHRVAS